MIKKHTATVSCIAYLVVCILLSPATCQSDDFQMHDSDYSQDQEQYHDQDTQQSRQPTQQEMQYFSQRRTACLVLSRYYLNQYSQSINDIIKDLQMNHKNLFINKMYATAVQKCEPLITQMEVAQFYTANNDQFDPSGMFHIFDGFNFYQLGGDHAELTPNQKAITKFIKDFDAEMEVRKEEEQAQKVEEERDEGVQVFFISLRNMSAQAKYIYIVLVIAICGAIVWYGFSQIGQQSVKKDKKKVKKQQ